MADEGIETAKARHEDELLARPNVVGVGLGERGGRPVVKVFVTHKVPLSELAPDERVPESVDGHEVDVEEIGAVHAQTPHAEG